jgi:hypothetical protein
MWYSQVRPVKVGLFKYFNQKLGEKLKDKPICPIGFLSELPGLYAFCIS